MKTIPSTKKGKKYLNRCLRITETTTTWATFWRIRHKSPEREEIKLKIARYKKTGGADALPEDKTEKQGLTLEPDETQNLLKFLSDDYEPFKLGSKRYIPIDGKFNPESIDYLEAIIETPEKQRVLDFIVENDILADELMVDLQNRARIKAVQEFETMLAQDLDEPAWQEWFKRNGWVLGTEFVRTLKNRKIDPANITDFLMQAYDGFLDIVEIKRPKGKLRFWSSTKDHENYVQSSDLTKAITQGTKYIYELECKADSMKFSASVGNVKTIKPRCILIFGRSNDWNNEQKEAYRILNSSYHNLTILTYDHVLSRAKRILGIDESEENRNTETLNPDNDDDIPF